MKLPARAGILTSQQRFLLSSSVFAQRARLFARSRFVKGANMRGVYDQITSFPARQGLYRIWVRANDRKGAPIVARWIDPRVEESVFQTAERNFEICEEICLAEESPESESGLHLGLVIAGAF
jgi:hypothetical protein